MHQTKPWIVNKVPVIDIVHHSLNSQNEINRNFVSEMQTAGAVVTIAATAMARVNFKKIAYLLSLRDVKI